MDRGLHSAEVVLAWTRSSDPHRAEKRSFVSALNDCLAHIYSLNRFSQSVSLLHPVGLSGGIWHFLNHKPFKLLTAWFMRCQWIV